MAVYKSLLGMRQATDNSPGFEKDYGHNEEAPVSGIYRCVSCGVEIAKCGGERFSEHHLTHDFTKGPILWSLIVATGI